MQSLAHAVLRLRLCTWLNIISVAKLFAMLQQRHAIGPCALSFLSGAAVSLLAVYVVSARWSLAEKKARSQRPAKKAKNRAAQKAATSDKDRGEACSGVTGMSGEQPVNTDGNDPLRRRVDLGAKIHAAPSEPSQLAVGKLDYVDRFLKWDCGPALLEMGLFPNAKEISESMACLLAIDNHLQLRFDSADVLCIVVGDGATPRTAALLAARTKWKRVVSIDPAMWGLPLEGCQPGHGNAAPSESAPSLSHPQAQLSSSRNGRMRERLKRIAEIKRLELLPKAIQDVSFDLESDPARHVVMVLPHAHVLPDVALGSLRVGELSPTSSPVPTISIVQMPCCNIEKHGSVCDLLPDVSYVDECVCGYARAVRIWKDASQAAVETSALVIGDRPTLTHQRVAQRVRSVVAHEQANRGLRSKKAKQGLA